MIKFITGVMKSGKSERLIEEIKKDTYQNSFIRNLIIKPISDTRDGAFVKTRAHNRKYPALMVDENDAQMVELVLNAIETYGTIFIDESQFFSYEFIKKLVDYCDTYYTDLIVSGLSKDFKGELFPSSAYLVNHADEIESYNGHCDYCESLEADKTIMVDAKTNRIIKAGSSFKVEGADNTTEYKIICKSCYAKHFQD